MGNQPMAEAEVRMHRGRPTIIVNEKPLTLSAYSPVAGRRPELFREQSARFFPHGLDLYLVTPSCGILPTDADHPQWCPPLFWRGLARWAGAHVWCESNDIRMADRSVVALHTLKPGPRTLTLPRHADVVDVIADQPHAVHADSLDWIAPAGPDTRVFRLQTAKE